QRSFSCLRYGLLVVIRGGGSIAVLFRRPLRQAATLGYWTMDKRSLAQPVGGFCRAVSALGSSAEQRFIIGTHRQSCRHPFGDNRCGSGAAAGGGNPGSDSLFEPPVARGGGLGIARAGRLAAVAARHGRHTPDSYHQLSGLG